jgi:hypothetical protein
MEQELEQELEQERERQRQRQEKKASLMNIYEYLYPFEYKQFPL